MPSQRACVAESQVRNKLSNGPLRAQSKELLIELLFVWFRVFCDVWADVTSRGYDSILLSARVKP